MLREIWRLIMQSREELFKFYAYIIILISCLVINILGTIRAPMFIRLCVAWLWSWSYRLGALIFLQIYIKVDGKKNIQKIPSVYVSKHQSMLETFVFYSLLFRCCFTMKQELLEAPIFGKSMVYTNAIPVDRENSISALKKVLSLGKQRLQEEAMSIIVFPEGTRVPVGKYPKFHKSAMKLAKVTEAPIVPVAHNFGKLFGQKKGDRMKPGIARISFLPVVNSAEYSVQELTDFCHKAVNDRTKELGG